MLSSSMVGPDAVNDPGIDITAEAQAGTTTPDISTPQTARSNGSRPWAGMANSPSVAAVVGGYGIAQPTDTRLLQLMRKPLTELTQSNQRLTRDVAQVKEEVRSSVARVEAKLASMEGQQQKSLRRVAELSGGFTGISDATHSLVHRIEAQDTRISEFQRDLEKEIRERHSELERRHKEAIVGTQSAAATLEETARRHHDRLSQLEDNGPLTKEKYRISPDHHLVVRGQLQQLDTGLCELSSRLDSVEAGLQEHRHRVEPDIVRLDMMLNEVRSLSSKVQHHEEILNEWASGQARRSQMDVRMTACEATTASIKVALGELQSKVSDSHGAVLALQRETDAEKARLQTTDRGGAGLQQQEALRQIGEAREIIGEHLGKYAEDQRLLAELAHRVVVVERETAPASDVAAMADHMLATDKHLAGLASELTICEASLHELRAEGGSGNIADKESLLDIRSGLEGLRDRCAALEAGSLPVCLPEIIAQLTEDDEAEREIGEAVIRRVDDLMTRLGNIEGHFTEQQGSGAPAYR